METIEHHLVIWAIQAKPYSAQLAVAFVATVLVISGGTINKISMQLVANQIFVVRILCFILLCTIGYGLLTVWLSMRILNLLAWMPEVYFLPAVLLSFIILGVIAEKVNRTS